MPLQRNNAFTMLDRNRQLLEEKVAGWSRDQRGTPRISLIIDHYYSGRVHARRDETRRDEAAAISLLHARCDRTRYAASSIVGDPGPGN